MKADVTSSEKSMIGGSIQKQTKPKTSHAGQLIDRKSRGLDASDTRRTCNIAGGTRTGNRSLFRDDTVRALIDAWLAQAIAISIMSEAGRVADSKHRDFPLKHRESS